jgi:hypothetical protein
MPSQAKCPKCGKTYRVPDHLVGKPVKCSTCHERLLTEDLPPAVADERPAIASRSLIPCETCGKSLACTAKACPHCGAENKWVHPEIQRFLASIKQFSRLPPFNYYYDKATIKGYADVKRGAWRLVDQGGKLAIIGFLFPFVAFIFFKSPILLVPTLLLCGLAVIVGLGMLVIGLFTDGKVTDTCLSFHIDFAANPPKWTSDDDEFWKDIKAFFFPSGLEKGIAG